MPSCPLKVENPSRRVRPAPSRAFTLTELLIVMAIIVLLLGLLLPTLSSTLSSARAFKCKMSLRSVAFDFSVFADDQLHGDRGFDSRDLPAGRFRLETFQNSQYGLVEFWNHGILSSVKLHDNNGRDPMRCAAVKGDVVLRRNVPCSEGGVSPPQNVSYGFNMRLHVSERQALAGAVAGVQLSSSILSGSATASPAAIPLAWDVDGHAASLRGVSPVFSAPTRSSQFLFANDQYWFPSSRHSGSVNVTFIDGHVETSREPAKQNTWAWDFEPAP